MGRQTGVFQRQCGRWWRVRSRERGATKRVLESGEVLEMTVISSHVESGEESTYALLPLHSTEQNDTSDYNGGGAEAAASDAQPTEQDEEIHQCHSKSNPKNQDQEIEKVTLI